MSRTPDRFRAVLRGWSAAFLMTAATTTLGFAQTTPNAPTNVTATGTNWYTIEVSWRDNATNETAFEVQRSTDGAAFEKVATVKANAQTYTDSGWAVVGSAPRHYRVRALNGAAASAFSNVATGATMVKYPDEPTNLVARGTSSSTIVLTWKDNASNEDFYEVTGAKNGKGWTVLATLPADSQTFSHEGLLPATSYTYRVRAVNTGGWKWTALATAQTLKDSPPPAVPAAPSALTARAVSDTRIELAWADNSSDETGFVIERASGGAYAVVGTVGANVAAWSNTGLKPDTEYQYRVLAESAAGKSSYSNTAITRTQKTAPPPPAVSLDGHTVSPSSVVGGGSATGKVTLSTAAPAGGARVALSSSGSAATVPASVLVPAGSASADFSITTQPVSAAATVTITASLGGASKTASLIITPKTAPPPTVRAYYVSPSGSDSAAGTESAPWKTLTKALGALRAGDTLYVRGGTYAEKVQPKLARGTSSSPIAVRAYPGERPVLSGLLRITDADYWTFDGLNVTWNAGIGTRTDHMVKITNGVGWTYKNAELWGARSFAGLLVAGTRSGEPSDWTVSGNVIHDIVPTNNTNQDHCIYANTGLAAGPGVIERNLLFNAPNGEGVKLGPPGETGGSANVTIRYNTIYNTGQSLLLSYDTKGTEIYGNLMSKVGGNYAHLRGYRLKGAGNRAHNNLGFSAKAMFLNDSGYTGIRDEGGNAFPVDPKFDSLTPDGFRPQNPQAKRFGVYAPAS